ncbi:D-alanyl-D-alanine carboxypeptidase [Iamia sp. SCSIO 61187]|uniref:D-alanyl-D-alanine carboxypeptidase family protein n=1 Tax=Iamia sp. SCSIO 61187 TaxID=2722752 RepID=UPI001C628370|nr:serine hydrolase [Iamia sp. SCSIO 61187]QYG94853.1 D-alanyl-D-alanine carboxypeptidase [Iamia sp. SCSIO 61187]
MSRRVIRLLVAALAVLATLVATGIGPAGAQEPPPPGPTDTVAPVPPPRASIVVDVETGEVITEANAREALPPASTTKILTALLARQHLDFEGEIGISGTAALAPPRRIGMQQGSSWGVRDLAYAMMLCSCNDAAWALGQAAGGGSMAGYAARSQALAESLGLADAPLLRDPAGLDDDRSVDGGNLLSARDLAIAGRAYLADPELAEIATAPGHEWVGGDGEPHTVRNLNAFLDAYPGAIGLKTGFTSRAGMTFVGAAERDGRTLLVVVLGSEAHYAHARELLDAGFMLAEVEATTGDTLPPVPGAGPAPTTTTTSTTTTSTAPEPASSDSDPATGPATPAADEETAAAPVRSTSSDAGLPAEVLWLVVGGVGVLVVVVVALFARERAMADTIDRRPAKPRRRDRRRGGS